MRKSIDNDEICSLYESILNEDMSSGSVFGGEPIPNGIENGDDYAEGDTRIPKVLGTYNRKGKLRKKPRKKPTKPSQKP